MKRSILQRLWDLNVTISDASMPISYRKGIKTMSKVKRRGYSNGCLERDARDDRTFGLAIMAQDSTPSNRKLTQNYATPGSLRCEHFKPPVVTASVQPSSPFSKSLSQKLKKTDFLSGIDSTSKRKRKAKSHVDGGRPTQRPRTEPGTPFINESYIRSNYEVPSQEVYPRAPPALFNIDTLVGALHNMGGQLWEMRKNMSRLHGPVVPGFTCTVIGSIPNFGSYSAVANGLNKREATKNAYLLFLTKLHESGVLKEAFGFHEFLNEETLQEEVDAKVDVYNYAARFGLVPKVSVRLVKSPIRARKNISVEVSIELEEQNIKVASRGPDMKTAEISASVKFKAAAEKYYAEYGDETIIIKDATALNTSNMKNFVEFYKLNRKDSVFTLDTRQAQGFSSRTGQHSFTSQVFLNQEPIGETVLMTGKKKAEEVAYLTAALVLTRDDPELLQNFKRAVSASSSGILLPVRPITMKVDPDAALMMKDTILQTRMAGLRDEKANISSSENQETARHFRPRRRLGPAEAKSRNIFLKSRLESLKRDPSLSDLRTKKEALPMNQYRAKVLSHVEDHQYSVIIGATGSGKTTQVPQILLEHAISKSQGAGCNIICTQPRRIAATSVARRVAEERNEKLKDSVGYHVRFDSKIPKSGGTITYCTTGILLQQLQHFPDEVFDSVSHLIIDEIHERDILIDFLLIILKKTIAERLEAGRFVPKVVLMSATIDGRLFANYFANTANDEQQSMCPSLSVPGRTFPVKEKYFENIVEELKNTYGIGSLDLLRSDQDDKEYYDIETSFSSSSTPRAGSEETGIEAIIDWKRQAAVEDGSVVLSNEREDALVPLNLVALTIGHIARSSKDGAILVFLPGLEEIQKVDMLLRTERILAVDFTNEKNYRIFTLHSTVPAGDQAAVFEPVPEGCRKIILSTNIAETSVTIPDVQYVVDTGKLREKHYDQLRRITKLQCTWISKSNAKQRAGRAGRVQNGTYYALYSRPRFDSLRAVGLPEMLRSDLQEICLDIKAQKFRSPIRQFLADAIEPPSATAVDASVENLVSLEALTKEEELTALGKLLVSLPVHPALGKMIVLGVIFRCLDPMVILGSIINERSLLVAPPDNRMAAKAAQSKFLEQTESDHFALINAFRQMRTVHDQHGYEALSNFAFENFLHLGAFRTLSSTTLAIEEVLVEARLIPFVSPERRHLSEIGSSSLNRNSDNVTLIKALALAGLHPNLAVSSGPMTFRTPGEKNTMMHPSSLNYSRRKGGEEERFSGTSILSYTTMAKSNDGKSIYLRDVSSSTPLMAVLFGGRLEAKSNVIEMDGWLPFYVKGDIRTAKLVMEFRKAMDRVLTSAFQNLANLKSKDDGSSLADEQLIEVFASGLVEVFNRDFYQPEGNLRSGRLSR